jgi:hypothetical protein
MIVTKVDHDTSNDNHQALPERIDRLSQHGDGDLPGTTKVRRDL